MKWTIIFMLIVVVSVATVVSVVALSVVVSVAVEPQPAKVVTTKAVDNAIAENFFMIFPLYFFISVIKFYKNT